jgi:hypothetical protein
MGGIYEVHRWDGFTPNHIHTKFHEDWYRRSSNIKVLPQKSERLWCRYYRWEGFVKYAVGMRLGVMMYIPSSVTTGSGIQKLLGGGGGDTHTDILTHRQQGDLISLLLFFFKIRKAGWKQQMKFSMMDGQTCSTEQVRFEATLWTWIREVLGSNLVRNTGCCDWGLS